MRWIAAGGEATRRAPVGAGRWTENLETPARSTPESGPGIDQEHRLVYTVHQTYVIVQARYHY
jgi:hypothetical protein